MASALCRKFVGQGNTDKSDKAGGGAGMAQREQKAVINGFRDYEFNTLVATCIGEEGLDIPAVDLIVCLDVSASPTRSVQRMGRTGRHRKGRVVYVLSEGREQDKYAEGLRVCYRSPGLRVAQALSPVSRSSASSALLYRGRVCSPTVTILSGLLVRDESQQRAGWYPGMRSPAVEQLCNC
jgi:hypothetical protein